MSKMGSVHILEYSLAIKKEWSPKACFNTEKASPNLSTVEFNL
jgi:hypothetical protein